MAFPAVRVSAAEEGGNVAESTATKTETAYLEYHVAPQPLITWGLNLKREEKAFQKEPDTAGRKVCRASFTLARPPEEEPMGFLWDFTKGTLYLDLNRNRDLTDDPEGVLNCPVSRFAYYSQSFTNAQFKVKTARGSYPLCVNLHLYNPERGSPSGSVALRSFWTGKIMMGGRDYQVGRADGTPGQLGLDNQGHLLLRPWEERDDWWDILSGSPRAAFAYAPNLYFGGQAYRVDCAFLPQEQNPRYKISFREKDAELGELKLNGQHIERLVLVGKPRDDRKTQTVFTAVLDRPGSLVKVPAGEYQHWRVALRAGSVNAHSDNRYGASQLQVTANTPPRSAWTVGGPLTNTVSAQQQGRNLSLTYQLLGAGGVGYQITGQGTRHPPQFAVYKNGKRIHSGQFEFG